MANSDYINRDRSFGFCPVAYLASGIGPLTTSVTMTGYSEPRPDGIRIGMAAMIDQEIVSVISRTGNSLTLGRGCCDTVPAAHDTGATIWFFDDSIGRDLTEYAGTETVSVKAMPRSLSGSVPKSHAVPKQITFSLRYARPYPPGNVKVDGDPWFGEAFFMDATNDTLTLTWAHRDRITQQDQLVVHGASSIGPEPGVTYTVRIYKADNTLLRTVTGITGTSWQYTSPQVFDDFEVFEGEHYGYFLLSSQRESLLSYQSYRIDFGFDASDLPQDFGLGYRLGQYVGGYPPPPAMPTLLTVGSSGIEYFVPSGNTPFAHIAFKPDGTVTVTTGGWPGAPAAFNLSPWISPNAAWPSVAEIAHLYQVTSVSDIGEDSSAYETTPWAANKEFAVTVSGFGDYQFIVQTGLRWAHPRFGSGEFGTYDIPFKFTLSA